MVSSHSKLTRRTALASAAAIALQKAGAQQQRKAVRVSAKEDRNGERIALGPNPNHCKISGKDSAGAISSFEATSLVKGGPPLHIHLDQDEWFYIVSGEYRFRVGNEEFLLKAGDSLFAPRQVPHTFAFVGDAPGRMLCTFQPAGDMEAFFRELGKISAPPAAEQMATLFAKHGMRVVGPPLPVA